MPTETFGRGSPAPKLLHSFAWPRCAKSSFIPARDAISAKSSKRDRQTGQARRIYTWREIDVDIDAETRRPHNDQVPLVFIDGRKAFKYHMDEKEFLRKLSASGAHL